MTKRTSDRDRRELDRMERELDDGLKAKDFEERFGMRPRDARRMLDSRSGDEDDRDRGESD